jgi:hypothetical protein
MTLIVYMWGNFTKVVPATQASLEYFTPGNT